MLETIYQIGTIVVMVGLLVYLIATAAVVTWWWYNSD